MARRISVRDCISQVAIEIGISQRPVITVINTNDADVAQMVALLSAVADEVMLDEPYKITLGDEVWLYDTDDNPKMEITADTDLIGFDARLAINGLKYRFLKAKGLEYGEEMRDFLSRLNKLATRVNGVVLDLYHDEDRQI